MKYSSGQDEVLPELYFQRRRYVRWRCVPRDLTGAETGGQRSSRGDRCAEERLDAAGRKLDPYTIEKNIQDEDQRIRRF